MTITTAISLIAIAAVALLFFPRAQPRADLPEGMNLAGITFALGIIAMVVIVIWLVTMGGI